MFNSSFEHHNSSKEESTKEIKDDFIVHNMPEAERFSGQTFSNTSVKQAPSKPAPLSGIDSHYKIGVLIIFGGVVLIGGLIYAAYVFMIKPAAKQPATPVTQTESPVIESPVVEEPVTPVVTPVVTPEVATSTTNETISTSTDLLPEEQTTSFVPSVVSTIDSDFDGLTDDEEKLIGTNPNLADTDNDSYLDIAELKSGYNPLNAGGKIDENSLFARYQVDSKASVLYLNAWEMTRSDANNTIVFTDEDKAFIQITFQDNEEKLSPYSWYEKQFSGLMPGESIMGEAWTGFYSQDNSAAYIFSNDLSKIYTITYSPLIENDLNFPFFRLMVKTMIIK
jgi:hypothetical protein